jgi:hypothetical protein
VRSVAEPFSTEFAVGAAALADSFAMALGGPIFLVGSALREARPHDVDIRAVVGECDLHRLFGHPDWRGVDEFRWRWHRYELKQSRRWSRTWMENVDFQVQTVDQAMRYSGMPRLRLDRIPRGYFLAGFTDA